MDGRVAPLVRLEAQEIGIILQPFRNGPDPVKALNIGDAYRILDRDWEKMGGKKNVKAYKMIELTKGILEDVAMFRPLAPAGTTSGKSLDTTAQKLKVQQKRFKELYPRYKIAFLISMIMGIKDAYGSKGNKEQKGEKA